MGIPRLPKLIRVGHARYGIETTKQENYGETRGDVSLILLRKGMSPSSVRETLLHELMHAMMHEASANEILGITAEDQEKFVRVVSPWMLGVIRDNPELLEFLTGDDEVH